MKENLKPAWIAAMAAILSAIITVIPSHYIGFQRGKAQSELPVVEILEPRPGAESSWCTRVRGSGAIPEGKTLVIASNEDQDTRFYFESFVTWSDEGWSATVQLGEEGDRSSVGTDFTLYAVVLDEELANYLASTNIDPNDTWWSSPRLLPPTADSRVREQVTVERSGERGACPV